MFRKRADPLDGIRPRFDNVPLTPFTQEQLMTISSSPRRGASNAVAILALLIALAALFFALCTDPMKPGFAFKVPFSSALSAYDLQSPTGAYKSEMQMELNQDFRAFTELQSKLDKRGTKEKLDSLKIESEHDFKTKKDDEEVECKILLVKYDSKKKKDFKEVVIMKKDKDSGFWVRAYEMSARDVEATNKDLAKKMREHSGEVDLPRFGPGGPGQ
jgi:hypothetical protein